MTKTSIDIASDRGEHRPRFEGLKRAVEFNAGTYLTAAGVIAAAFAVSRDSQLWRGWRALARLTAILTSFQTISSLVASHWVYDLSSLHHMQWLGDLVPNPRTILNVVAGYDETTRQLKRVYPSAQLNVIDFYDDLELRESSIERAHAVSQSGDADRQKSRALARR